MPSIRSRGALVPFLVRPDGKSVEIVAGRRRYFAAKVVVKERGKIAPLPCGALEPRHDAGALEASMIENLHRLDAGKSVGGIMRGVTISWTIERQRGRSIS